MVSKQVTYERLGQVLRQLGFNSRKVEPRWHRYEHAASDTVIIVGDRTPTESVLPSELVSARRHLIDKGLVDAAELEQMLSPPSPRQKSTSGSQTEK
jgi:hypothetical protein